MLRRPTFDGWQGGFDSPEDASVWYRERIARLKAENEALTALRDLLKRMNDERGNPNA